MVLRFCSLSRQGFEASCKNLFDLFDRIGFLKHSHRLYRGQQLLLAINQVAGIIGSQLKAVPVGDGVSGTRLDAVAAEDAAVVINVVDLRVALSAADAVLFSVLSRFNVNAVRRTRGCAQETGHTLLQAILIALQDMKAAKTLLKYRALHWPLAIRVVLYHGRRKHLPKS